MPRQEPLPAVLAMVLVNQRLIVIVSTVLDLVIDVIDPTERGSQLIKLCRGKTIEICALTRLSLAVSIPFGAGGKRLEFSDLAETNVRDLCRACLPAQPQGSR